MKKSYLIALGIAIIAGLWMASGTIERNGTDQTEETSDTQPRASRSLNTVNTVQTRTLKAEEHTRKILINGRTEASRMARISAEIEGQINDIRVDDGSRMEKGDVIATIKIDDRQVALNSARNRVKQFELEYKTARNLVERGFSTEVQVATRKAELEDAKAALRRAEIALQNTKIRAPFDGVLEQRSVEEGDYVQIGTEVALFLDLDPVYVVGFVAEQRIQEVQTGQPGIAILPDGSRHEGRVHYISRAADPETRTFRVELKIDNPELEIGDGLTAELQLEGKMRRAHSITPAVLTLSENGDIGMKYIDEQGRAQFQPVTITDSQADAIWVEGLPDPVQVIVIGQDFVETGEKVSAVEADDDIPADKADATEEAETPTIPITEGLPTDGPEMEGPEMEGKSGERAD